MASKKHGIGKRCNPACHLFVVVNNFTAGGQIQMHFDLLSNIIAMGFGHNTFYGLNIVAFDRANKPLALSVGVQNHQIFGGLEETVLRCSKRALARSIRPER